MAQTVYVLGPRLRLDAVRRELHVAGEPVDVKRKAVDILCALAEAGGEIVSKDELLARVWPEQVVEENNLQVHVSALRKVLARHGSGIHLVTIPGRGYRLIGANRAASGLHLAPEAAAGPAVAVLPFSHAGGRADTNLLAQGIVEEIGLALSRVRWISVIGAASTAHAMASHSDPRKLAEEFGAHYLVQGSLRRQGDRLRLSAQLCETQAFTNVWSASYERNVADVFELEDEISASIASAIEPSIERVELERIRRIRPTDLKAYECVLRAAASLRSLMPGGAREALGLLGEALRRDPGYAWARALKGWCHHVLYSREGQHTGDRDEAIACARAALASGPEDAQVLATCALVLWFDAHEVETSFDLFKRASQLSPSNFLALAGSAVALAWSGEPETAAQRAGRALHLNPYHPMRYLAWQGLAGARFQQGDAAAAAVAASRAVEANPGFSVPLAYLSAAQALAGDGDAASATAARLLFQEPAFRISRFRLTVGVNDSVFDRFASAWRQAGLPD